MADYDYEAAGFDGFLSRSIDSVSQINLDSPGPTSTAQAYDRTQVTGSLGDTLQIGNIFLDGASEAIELLDGRNKPLLVGLDSKGNQAVKVAKKGFDARTARDDQLIFNSAQNALKVVKSDTGTVTTTGQPTNWATIPHNLGFAPIPLVFLNGVSLSGIASGANIPLPTYSNVSIDVVGQQIKFGTWLHALADNLNLYVVLFNSLGTSFSLNFKFYLLQESAS